MTHIIFIFLGVISLAMMISFLIWRFLSQRYTIPCPSFLGWLIEMENPFFRSSHASAIVGYVEIFPRMNVLEVGCGPGRITVPLAKAIELEGGKVLALDMQEDMLSLAREKVKKAGLKNVDYLQAELGKGRIPVNCYDLVLLVNVLGEIPVNNQITALKEIYDALKVGGILQVGEIICDPHFQPKQTVVNLASKVGFEKKNVFGSWASYTICFEKSV
jgi:ubiquinone/menaquinone biosynthesis C-methylase UbiE